MPEYSQHLAIQHNNLTRDTVAVMCPESRIVRKKNAPEICAASLEMDKSFVGAKKHRVSAAALVLLEKLQHDKTVPTVLLWSFYAMI